MPDVRYLSHDVLTGDLISDGVGDVTASSWGKSVVSVVPGSITIPRARVDEFMGRTYRDGLARVMLTVVVDKVPEWSGLLLTASRAGPAVTLSGADVRGLLNRRALRQAFTFTDVDQATIVKDLIDHVQTGRSDRDLRIDTTVTPTGRTRVRSYPTDEPRLAGEVIQKLSEVLDGFHWWIEPELSSAPALSLSQRLRIVYPRVQAGTPTHTLRNRLNAEFGTTTFDASGRASDGVGIGGGSTSKLVSRRGAAVPGFPALEFIESWTTVEDPATLADHVDDRLGERSVTTILPTVQVVDDGTIDPLELGDTVRLLDPEDDLDVTAVITRVGSKPSGRSVVRTLELADVSRFTS